MHWLNSRSVWCLSVLAGPRLSGMNKLYGIMNTSFHVHCRSAPVVEFVILVWSKQLEQASTAVWGIVQALGPKAGTVAAVIAKLSVLAISKAATAAVGKP